MKYSVLTAALLASASVSGIAQADSNNSATLTVVDHIAEKCDIGLKYAGSTQSGVGVSGLSPEFESSAEINLVDSNDLGITGAVNCNAHGGYQVKVSSSYGGMLQHQTNSSYSAGYTLTPIGVNGSALTAVAGPISLASPTPIATTSGYAGGEQQFKLKLSGLDLSSLPAGTYTDQITFEIDTL